MLDARLLRNVLDELAYEPDLDASGIEVDVTDGIATLSGTVASCRERKLAEDATARLRGIRGIRQTITVELPETARVSDDLLQKRATKALGWNGLVPSDAIKVSVENGQVILEGKVEWHGQKAAALDCVRNLAGVRELVDRVAIVPCSTRADIGRTIENALRRQASVEAHGIRISIKDGRAVLAGHVHDWSQRRSAERIAWGAPGVHTVEDRIQVR